MTRLLDQTELTRQLADLDGVLPGRQGTLELAVRAPDFPAAVRLVGLVAADAEAMNHHPDIDLRWRTVVFTLATHSAGGVTQLDVELAHQILAAAREVGATVLAPPERVEIALDAADPAAVRPFWEAALGYHEQTHLTDDGIELQDPTGRGPVLWFQTMDPPRPGRGRFHLDVYLAAADVAARRQSVETAGGRLVTDEFAPSWWVYADVEGNEVCLCVEGAEPADERVGP